MTTLLQLNTSLFSEAGQSSQLAREFVQNWQRQHPGSRVIVRDLATDPVPHLSGERFKAFLTPAEQRTAEQHEVTAFSDGLIDELKQADVIVVGLPLYNYGIPSSLQAYFDHVARAGVTFKYTANGPVGFLQGKRAVVFATRGGKYLGSDNESVTTQVRNFFKLLGITDIEFVYAEGLSIDAVTRENQLIRAREQGVKLAAA
ncbi:MAG TPA: NAD(P)H-dependent oxidoreductase [Steroidobacteraceae bacterium]|nr:NAD(P)H-dependent oxidoreductase [Steroidobacteraceae bacterium]